MKTKRRIRVVPYFKWFDLWIGRFVDVPKRTVYVQPLPMVGVKIFRESTAVCPGCDDCGIDYSEFFMDVVLPNDQWELVSGNSEGGGLLCAACIVKRAAALDVFTVAKMVLE